MFFKFIRVGFLIALAFGAAVSINAQGVDASTRDGKPSNEELPKNIRENLEKQRIEQEEKDYKELLKRGEEALKLSEDLGKSFTANNKLSSEDRKKLERLEKLVKKIRSDLGGDDDDAEEDEAPATVSDALKFLQENTVKLVGELKKSTRHSISAVAIHSSNLLLRVVKFIRFGQ